MDRIVRVCESLADKDDRRFNRCLIALRKSGRDVQFNGYIGAKRIRNVICIPALWVLDRLTIKAPNGPRPR